MPCPTSDIIDYYETRSFEFSVGVLDALIVHLVLSIANTIAACNLPISDPYIYAMYSAYGASVIFLLAKMFAFDWDAPAHALLPMMFIIQLIRWASIWRLQGLFLKLAVARGLLWDRLTEDDIENSGSAETAATSSKFTLWELLRVLKPYFWPNAGADSALMNRVRSCATWICVAASKAASIMAPLYLAKATNALSDGRLTETYTNALIYSILLFASAVFKEAQGLVYLKVKQQAYIEIAEHTFSHLHALSLQWHLKENGKCNAFDGSRD